MKKLIILLLLSYTLFAQNISHTIPLALQKKLCDKLANNANRCDNGSTLDYYTHAKLKDNKLLIFVYLNEHVEKMYARSEGTVPVIVDQYGRWISTVGDNIITEDIKSIHQDPHGSIWVRALWQIEGVYPAYYHSSNGLRWKRTVLPRNRDVDCCFETVDEPLFLFNTLTLTFKNLEGKNAKSWGATYKSAMSNNPIWQPLIKVPSSTISSIDDSNWKVSKTKNKITFVNKYSNKKIHLNLEAKANEKIYHIQVGAYTKESSAKKVKKSLKNLPYHSKIVKGKKYHKLFIGEFTSAKKAKFILGKLKREHPKNIPLKKAFVLSSKP
jgi:hypothetical protein